MSIVKKEQRKAYYIYKNVFHCSFLFLLDEYTLYANKNVVQLKQKTGFEIWVEKIQKVLYIQKNSYILITDEQFCMYLWKNVA